MNEIRFNSPQPEQKVESSVQSVESIATPSAGAKKSFFTSKIKKSIKIIATILVVAALVAFLAPMLKSLPLPKIFGKGTQRYSAVFLTNGQVYFGKMRSESKSEIVLENVYYLQANANGTTPSNQTLGSSFQLVKLGNELHGPTDELFINRNQVVFYEYLRDDSKVVESINKQ